MKDLIQQLKDSREKVMEFYQLPEELLDLTYGKGKWTIKQILHHLADSESVLYDRIRRVIANPNQVIWAFDQDAWCDQLDYNSLPLPVNEALFLAVRNAIIVTAQRFYNEKHWNKEFVHSESGIRTLKEEFEKVAWHCDQHIRQIEQALDKKADQLAQKL